MRRYIVVGSGAAGIAAIEAIRSQDAKGEIIMIAEDRDGYYSRPGLAYVLTKEVPESNLYPFSKQDFNYLQIKWLHACATRIHTHAHCVEIQDGRNIKYDRLLLATGSRAVRIQVPGIDLKGSIKLDNLDDIRSIIKLARRGKKAVVVGGGITALELVEGLTARGVQAHYFLRDDRYWSNILDEYESRIVEERLKSEGVKIHYHTELAEILGKKGCVTGVRTKNGEVIPCDMVAVAIGVRPHIQLASTCDMKTDRGVLVDENMQTSIADIFAAGDIGQVLDPKTGKSVIDTLWGPARNQGTCAGLNMAGNITKFRKPMAYNVTRLAGLTTTIIGKIGGGKPDPDLIGIARGQSESWLDDNGACDKSLITAQSCFDVNRLRIMIGENSIQGGFILGDQTLSQPIQNLIARQANISPIRERLMKPDCPLLEIITGFYNEWQAHNAT